MKFSIKCLALSITLVACLVTQAIAASAVAANKETGSYGYAFGKKTVDEAKKAAIANCPGGGEVIASSDKDGFGAVLRTVNNWKEEGQTIEVVGLVALADPVGIRKPGTEPCPNCQIVMNWYDNSTSGAKELFEGEGGKAGPEVLKVDATNRRSGEFRDLKVIDGRELRNGFGTTYENPETKKVMDNRYEYKMGLRDGMSYSYDYVEGQDPIVDYDWTNRDGWRTGFKRKYFDNGALEEYAEVVRDVKNGAYYKYHFKGFLLKKCFYRNDLEHGMCYEYSSSTGLLYRKGMYDFDKKEGEWITYAADGVTVKKKENYSKGMLID